MTKPIRKRSAFFSLPSVRSLRGAAWLLAPALLLAGLLATAPTPVARADVALDEAGTLKLYGDFRLRYEVDFDSVRADGITERDDRARLRIRGRLGVNFEPIPEFALGARVRTGSVDSQQSPHITIADFSGDPTGDEDVVPDKWFVKGKRGSAWAWAGRNSFPFWKQNELFWDDDVTPAGLAVGFTVPIGPGELAVNGGYFTLPDGAVDLHGVLGAGQLVYSAELGGIVLTHASGLFVMNGSADFNNLRNGNGARDYTIWVGDLQAKTKVAGLPLTFGLVGMHNFENYSGSELVLADAGRIAADDETVGVVVSLILGQTKEAGDWLLGYYYAYIDTFAVNASFAQDDWFRFGSATQTDASDFEGHEFRFGYAFAKNFNVVARLYIVDAINTEQDGNRFRLDFNFKF